MDVGTVSLYGLNIFGYHVVLYVHRVDADFQLKRICENGFQNYAPCGRGFSNLRIYPVKSMNALKVCTVFECLKSAF